MALPHTLMQIKLAQFDVLIMEGAEIEQNAKTRTISSTTEVWSTSESVTHYKDKDEIDWQRLANWKVKVICLLYQVLPANTYRARIENFGLIKKKKDIRHGVGVLQGFRESFRNGLLDEFADQISAAISADYLSQAEGLLDEGKLGNYGHVPAAVLTGAILERRLKAACSKQKPPISLTNASGKQKTLDPVIDDLKAVGAISDGRAKQLKAWAHIRNKAAHGEFEEFNRAEVVTMLQGVRTFLEEFQP